MTNEHPELSGYDPGDGVPLRSPRVLLVMRVVVIMGIIGLVLPGVVTTLSVGSKTAASACAAWVARYAPSATGSSARFELFGPGGAGWQCYSVGAFGGDEIVASLGLIPRAVRIPASG